MEGSIFLIVLILFVAVGFIIRMLSQVSTTRTEVSLLLRMVDRLTDEIKALKGTYVI